MYSIQSENGKIHNCDHGKLRSGLKKKGIFILHVLHIFSRSCCSRFVDLSYMYNCVFISTTIQRKHKCMLVDESTFTITF